MYDLIPIREGLGGGLAVEAMSTRLSVVVLVAVVLLAPLLYDLVSRG